MLPTPPGGIRSGGGLRATTEYCHLRRAWVATFVIPETDIAQLRLDEVDRRMLEEEAKTVSDVAQNTELITRRIEQQYEKMRKVSTWDGEDRHGIGECDCNCKG